jgi:hypothetical protein
MASGTLHGPPPLRIIDWFIAGSLLSVKWVESIRDLAIGTIRYLPESEREMYPICHRRNYLFHNYIDGFAGSSFLYVDFSSL